MLDTFSDYFKEIHFQPISVEFIVLLLIIIVLLAISGFVSASEVSFFSLSRREINELKEKNEKRSKTVLKLKNNSEYLLAAILILNNFVNAAVVISSCYAFSLIADFSRVPILGFILQIIIIAFILLLFGEMMPKIYATQNALKFALKAAPIYPFLVKILSPVGKILVNSTSLVNKRMEKHRQTNISVSELSQVLELTSDEITEDKEILEGIVKFGNTSVAEVMTPRLNVIDVHDETDYANLLKLISENGYSRMPVYAETHDDIKGILYIKDLLPHLAKKENFRWQTLIRPAYFVPETKKINDLLEEFQKNKIHMAVVVDEYGGTSGVITMEDILEEIVGEISDEYDNDDKSYRKIDNYTYIFEAKTLLVDFFKITEVDSEEFSEICTDADSLAGMILELKGEIPKEKEKIDFKNYAFEILSADNRKIEKVKFHIKK